MNKHALFGTPRVECKFFSIGLGDIIVPGGGAGRLGSLFETTLRYTVKRGLQRNPFAGNPSTSYELMKKMVSTVIPLEADPRLHGVAAHGPGLVVWQPARATLTAASFCLALSLAGAQGLRPAPSGAVGPEQATVTGSGSGSIPRDESDASRSEGKEPSCLVEVVCEPAPCAAAEVERFRLEREASLAAAAARIGVPLVGTSERVVLHAGPASMPAGRGAGEFLSIDGTTLHAVRDPFSAPFDPAADAAVILEETWGPAGTALPAGWVARWAADLTRGESVADVAGRIVREEGPLTLAALLGQESDRNLSPLVREPLGAAWLAWVAGVAGTEGVRRLHEARPTGLRGIGALAPLLRTSPEALEGAWRSRMRTLAARTASSVPQRRPLEAGLEWRGVSFSHDGWRRGGGGYGSEEAEAELKRLRSMGINAIALVPYGFMRSDAEPGPAFTRTDETDEAMARTVRMAHGLGMKVLLKPQIWLAHGAFTGDMRLDDRASRARFMEGYRRFALHYARLAEMEGFDLLSIGAELGGLTCHQDDWRALIAQVRRVYRGPLTYAANWGSEAESLTFWDALDCLGVNDYYPLSREPEAAQGELLAGARAVASRLERLGRKWGKPVLLTEVGYPSVRGATVRPWTESGEASSEEQAAGYRASLEALSGRSWLLGMFWWKWPSSGRRGGQADTSHSPVGKPAAEILRAWYSRGAPRPPGAAPPRATDPAAPAPLPTGAAGPSRGTP